jgi:hypothetical protein
MSTPTGSTQSKNSREVVHKTAASLDQLVAEVRSDIANADEPKAQALLETTAEVLLGLKKACQDYAAGAERAWK